MSLVRRASRGILNVVDRWYHRWHQLVPAGALLFVGRSTYDGPARQFADGTELKPGDPLGTLHFNNARLAALEGSTPAATGLRFRRLLFASLRALSELSSNGPTFRDIAVYRGIGWLRHGEQIGFLHEPVPQGWRTRWVTIHVRLLVWAFASPGSTALEARPELTVTWLTRRTLLERFGHDRDG